MIAEALNVVIVKTKMTPAKFLERWNGGLVLGILCTEGRGMCYF